MSDKVQPIPPGFGPVTPHLVVRDCAGAISFYQKAFGAEEVMRMPAPGGQLLMHAQILIHGAPVMLVDESPDWGAKSPLSLGGTPVTLHLYVADVDAAVAQARDAGCEVTMGPDDMFWGDRYARLSDPYGHSWSIATHVRDLSPEEMQEAMAAALADWPENK